jgi:hypothetical protein
VSSHS